MFVEQFGRSGVELKVRTLAILGRFSGLKFQETMICNGLFNPMATGFPALLQVVNMLPHRLI